MSKSIVRHEEVDAHPEGETAFEQGNRKHSGLTVTSLAHRDIKIDGPSDPDNDCLIMN